MDMTKAFENFDDKLKGLKEIVKECDRILISSEPLSFVSDNVNFFTKSFLINLCGYLETYLKDVLELFILDINEELKKSAFPHNLVRWSIETKPNTKAKVSTILEKGKCRYEPLMIKLQKRDLDPFISGNPFRTRELFKMFGFDLGSSQYFNNSKELINTIIVKRNNILHHNDDASDLSNSDILTQIKEIKNYAMEIDNIIGEKRINC